MLRRSRFRHDLPAGHRERHVLLREVPVAGHRHRGLRLRAGHVHLLAARRLPDHQLRLAGHRRRDRRPGVHVHAVRHAVPAAGRAGPTGVRRQHVHHHPEHCRAAGHGTATAERRERRRRDGRGHRHRKPVVRALAQLGRRSGRGMETAAAARQAGLVADPVAAQPSAARQRERRQRVQQRSEAAVAVHHQPARTGRPVFVRIEPPSQQPPAEPGVLRQSKPEALDAQRQWHHVPEGHILQRQPGERESEPQKVGYIMVMCFVNNMTNNIVHAYCCYPTVDRIRCRGQLNKAVADTVQ